MRLNKILPLLTILTTLLPASVSAEIKTFIGIDVVKIDTELIPADITLEYEMEAVRLRFGIENSDGGSAGIELMSGDEDVAYDQFGFPLYLKQEEAFGVYATLGKPIYLRVGWSIWKTVLDDPGFGFTTEETVDSFELGIGFNLLLGHNLTLYADWSVKDTEAFYPGSFTGSGEVDYHSELLTAGFNMKF